MKTSKYITSTAVVLTLFALCFPGIALAAIDVELVVNTSGTSPVLEVISNSSPCPNDPDKSCIAVAKRSSPNLRFSLEDACQPGGPEYKLEGIRITMINKVWPTTASPLPPQAAGDFFADANTGVIDLVNGNGGANKLQNDRIKFKDKNSHAYTVFYEISAKQCTGTGTIKLDPSIGNTGK
ncbi:MAG TPA: hypothetical protein VI566_09420 [Xanthomonadales bacterium]|nr:hypothetical protein [Xanthomonadales bacterium]